jgi:DNA-binding response OmpR family regulator
MVVTMKKIIIIEDEESVGKLIADELSDEDHEGVWTSDCGGVMEMIGKSKPDLIVLDIRLGEYDGLNLLQEIRNVCYDLPVILCSAYSTFENDLRSVAADYYVVKSPDLTELKMKVNMALGETGPTPEEEPREKTQTQNLPRVSPDTFLG